ncbi:MAG: transketolase [Acidobacteria bacterium]|nr:transketolase [Acidobacteriota bacterium]
MRQDGCQELAVRIRSHALQMTHRARSSHVGSCLSIADLLAVLYQRILRVNPNQPEWEERDRFLLSKGHAAAALYAVLAERGFFPSEWLETYCQDGARLAGHITHHGVPGVEVSTGSLGHGLAMGCGMALAAKCDSKAFRVFVLLSDGECDEGSTWEAALFAPHHRLDNLAAIVDYNRIQSFGSVKDVLDLDPLAEKWKAFGWGVREINGHDLEEIEASLRSAPFKPGQPSCVIAHTVKGRGVSFMEHKLAWHYQSPNAKQLQQALAELGEQQ